MDAAQTIRDCIADVTALRLHRARDPALGAAVARIKTLQARRFAGTYADLMNSPTLGPAALFFLQELYNDRDYSAREGLLMTQLFDACSVACETELARTLGQAR